MSPKGAPREKFNFMIGDDERVMLDALADRDNRTAADWLRVAIRRAYSETFDDKAPKKPKPKK